MSSDSRGRTWYARCRVRVADAPDEILGLVVVSQHGACPDHPAGSPTAFHADELRTPQCPTGRRVPHPSTRRAALPGSGGGRTSRECGVPGDGATDDEGLDGVG